MSNFYDEIVSNNDNTASLIKDNIYVKNLLIES